MLLIIAVYSETHKKCINTLCGQNVALLIAKAGGIRSYRKALQGYMKTPDRLGI
jgi:hypothetical protein